MIRIVLGALLLSALPARAQIAPCSIPDNLDGPCCEQADLIPPDTNPIQLPGKGICWDGCQVAQQSCTSVSISNPAPTPICGQYTAEVKVGDCSGATILEGSARLDYTRGWSEAGAITPSPGGPTFQAEFQVWRFLIKADLKTGPTPVIAPCPVPSCIPQADTAFFYGYVDYAIDCATGIRENAVVLFHGCDWLIHGQLLSDKPGTFHPDRSYAIVAPDTPVNPFVPSDFLLSPEAILEDGMRRVSQPGALFGPCWTTEEVDQGSYFPIGYGCLCPPSTGATQAAAVRINASSTCGSSAQSLNFFGTTPWLHTISHSIGNWTTPLDYPGEELVRVDEGLFLYADACPAVTPVDPAGVAFEIFYGSETFKGFAILPDPATPNALSQHFVDLASNYRAAVGQPASLPAIGSVRPTSHLLYLNPQ